MKRVANTIRGSLFLFLVKFESVNSILRMSKKTFVSFIVPVYNRSGELRELLESFRMLKLPGDLNFEIIIVDDGSDPPLEEVVQAFGKSLPVNYFYKKNSGPGDSRNQAMQKAQGDYFVILDSDVILPEDYLKVLSDFIQKHPEIDMFGGPDTDAPGFHFFQKAVNLSMTSFLTTGGIRGKKKNVQRYVPRSFNMILKREVFEETGGFSAMHPGEDPEWVYRIWRKGFRTGFAPDLKVFHKRRIDWKSFFRQMKKFGMTRCILNRMYPEADSWVYRVPLVLVLWTIISVMAAVFVTPYWLLPLALYLVLVFVEFLWHSHNPLLSLYALAVFMVQIFAYASGFLTACLRLGFSGRSPEALFPDLYFKSPNK